MPAWDESSRRIVLRIVYDGPGFAGKTTNLSALTGFFTTRRRSELITPEAVDGRTQYFDWMDLDGGLVQGYTLRCRLLTVPGQRRLAGRREALLRSADAVVLVCESTPAGALQAYRMLDVMGARLERIRPDVPPLIVQANKQDLAGALSPEEIRDALALDASVPVVPARASAGTGVRETLVLAIRAAADRVQLELVRGGLDLLERDQETPERLLERLRDVAPVATAPSLRLELATETATPVPDPPEPDGAAPEVPTLEAPATARPAPEAPAPEPHLAVRMAPEPSAPEPDPPEPPAPSATTSEAGAPERPPLVPEPSCPAPRAPTPAEPEVGDADEWGAASRSGLHLRPAVVEPPWPDPDAATGSIWPAAKGRELLRRVRTSGAPERRDDLRGRTGSADGSGKSDLMLYRIGEICMKTSPRRRFDDPERARMALLALARQKSSLGALLPPQTVLCLAGSGAEGTWLWTVSPWVRTLGVRMEDAVLRGDRGGLAAALMDFADAVITSLLLTARRSIVLDAHPSNFASTDEGMVYLDDDIAEGREAPAIGYSLLRRVEEYAHFGEATERYVDALERGLAERLRADDVSALGLERALEGVPGASPRMRDAAARLTLALQRVSRGTSECASE